MKKSPTFAKMLLSAALLIPATFINNSNLKAQSKQLDSTVFDTWRTCESLAISDDASWSIATYKNKKDGTILVVKIDKLRLKRRSKVVKILRCLTGRGLQYFL